MELRGKISIVTGGSRGIGRAISILLGEKGANVVVNYLRSEKDAEITLEEIKKRGGEGIIKRFDVSDYKETEKACKEIVNRFGSIDILVNNAGITRDSLLLRMGEDEWDEVININLKGVFNCTKSVIRYMIKARYGKIVNITSVVGEMGNAGQVNYSASKSGIIGFTKTLAKEVANRGINVNAVAPGFIKTDMTESLSEKVKEEMKAKIPMGKFGNPLDVANAVYFLISDASVYITGHVLNVNGGLFM
jgi:3-oxoacyl-[acyl-carrier protein] reductase